MPLKRNDDQRPFLCYGVSRFHALLFVFVPIYTIGVSDWCVGFIIFTVSQGLCLSIVFQLGYCRTYAIPVAMWRPLSWRHEWAVQPDQDAG